jgi:hypothetical protein
MWGISWPAEDLLASQGLRSTELRYELVHNSPELNSAYRRTQHCLPKVEKSHYTAYDSALMAVSFVFINFFSKHCFFNKKPNTENWQWCLKRRSREANTLPVYNLKLSRRMTQLLAREYSTGHSTWIFYWNILLEVGLSSSTFLSLLTRARKFCSLFTRCLWSADLRKKLPSNKYYQPRFLMFIKIKVL